MRPVLDLLPYRIDQAIVGNALRKLRVARKRRVRAVKAAPVSGRTRRLYIDLAVISRHDAGTGIQRVVRALAIALIEEEPSRWDIRFVAADRRRAYHAISWPVNDLPAPGPIIASAPIEGRPGDVFLGLDFSLDTVRFHRRQLARFRRDGGKLWFLICDLLPVEHPEWFAPNNVVRYRAWIDILAGIADGFLCISSQTENDLERVLGERYGLNGGYRSCIIPMGHSIRESMFHLAAAPHDAENGRCLDVSHPFTLMVGTLEPRKGHADILSAFDTLWQQGAEDRLVLVGRMGWRTEELRDAIRSHPEHGRKLLWFDDVEDPELERIYQACQGVIIASLAEGFGLPLIEAIGHGKPVLARDLPVFRVHEHLGVRFFPADAKPRCLAQSLRTWIDDVQACRIVVGRPSASWREAAKTVLSAIT